MIKRILFSFLFVSISGLGIYLYGEIPEVLFESLESKTSQGTAVYNRIRFFSNETQDIWIMNQSQHGFWTAPPETWDRLAITIDKTQRPWKAQFYQMQSGPLEWSWKWGETPPQTPFRVACFMCHNNGPRWIRANLESPLSPMKWKDRLNIWRLNLKISQYGRIESPNEEPFRHQGIYENQILQVKSCVRCHRDEGGRGALTRQQFPTIQFMLETGEMPPRGHSISDQEKSEIERFLRGE